MNPAVANSSASAYQHPRYRVQCPAAGAFITSNSFAKLKPGSCDSTDVVEHGRILTKALSPSRAVMPVCRKPARGGATRITRNRRGNHDEVMVTPAETATTLPRTCIIQRAVKLIVDHHVCIESAIRNAKVDNATTTSAVTVSVPHSQRDRLAGAKL